MINDIEANSALIINIINDIVMSNVLIINDIEANSALIINIINDIVVSNAF